MIFVMHPNQYIPETGYLMCGEPVVITAEGRRSAVRAGGRSSIACVREADADRSTLDHDRLLCVGPGSAPARRVRRSAWPRCMPRMDANGWKAVLIYGDANEHSALAYFTNFVPRLRWGMALIPREGEPRLLASMSSRDVPAMKLMTFIPDVLSGWNWDTAFDPWLAKLTGDDPMDIGTRRLRPDAAAAVPLAGEKPRQPLPPAGGRRRRRGLPHDALAPALAGARRLPGAHGRGRGLRGGLAQRRRRRRRRARSRAHARD